MQQSAGFIVCVRDGEPKFLLLRNATHGTWGFPKGHLDAGETALDAAWRELDEETGWPRDVGIVHAGFEGRLRYTVRAHAYGTDAPPAPQEKEVHAFLLELPPSKAGDLRLSSEHDAARWLTATDARALLGPFRDIADLLDAAREWLSHAGPHAG